jgi:polyisoprenoid-binding protein YceI
MGEGKGSRRGWVVAGVVVVLALVAAAVWWFALRDTAPPPAAVDCEVEGSDETVPVDGDWSVEPGEDVFAGYRIEEVFGGDTFKREIAGRSPEVEGTLTVEDGSLTEATVTVDTTALASDQARRDRWLEGNALDTEEFPEAAFVLTEPIALPDDPAVGEGIAVDATGELTLHGTTREVVFPIEACFAGDSASVAGSIEILLEDYGIEPPDVPGLAKVDPDGIVELQLAFVPGA